MAPTLSLCVMTPGPPERIRALLELCRPHVDEVVLVVDSAGDLEVLDACADLADQRVVVECRQVRRLTGWMYSRCRGDWLLRLDDDEVPSAGLLRDLPRLIALRRPAAVLLRRHWLHPVPSSRVSSRPWSPDWQVRLLRNVPGLWTFTGLMHDATQVVGERHHAEHGIYHLDPLLQPLAARRAKRDRYEAERPGMLNDGVGVNEVYVPEDHHVDVEAVPPDDVALIERVLAGSRPPRRRRPRGSQPERLGIEQVERLVGTRTVTDDAHRARVWLAAEVGSVRAGEAFHVEVVTENLGTEWWPAGEVEPVIRLGYEWRSPAGDRVASGGRGAFTEVVEPGAVVRTPLRVVAPPTVGGHVLEVGVVHEHVQWFDGDSVRVPVEVGPPSGGSGAADAPIVFGQPRFTGADVAELVQAVESGWPGTGPRATAFAERVSEMVGAAHVVPVSSGSAALQLALRALGVGPGDEVITTTLTFVATASAIVAAGAEPVLVDVDPGTRNIDPAAVAAAIGPRTAAIVPVHLAGLPCDMDAIAALAARHGLAVVEDAAHAFGAAWRGAPVGSLSPVTAFSFNAVKNLAMGDGGAVATDDEGLARRVRTMAHQGIDQTAWQRVVADAAVPPATATELGIKANLTDVNAALGLHQLAGFAHAQQHRAELWRAYDRALFDLPVEVPPLAPDHVEHARHLYSVVIHDDLADRRDAVRAHMWRAGVGTGVHYVPVHRHPWWSERLGLAEGAFPHAERVGRATASLPMSAHLDLDQLGRVVRALSAALDRSAR